MATPNSQAHQVGAEIRIRGTVQGVGFRPMVYRLAQALALRGVVCNDGAGVLVRVAGAAEAIARFIEQLPTACPPLAHIATLECQYLDDSQIEETSFQIGTSQASDIHTAVAPDAATCAQCQQEIQTPDSRYFQYPFTNCTHCGPRLSIIQRLPYDRAHTSMAAFSMCPACTAAYANASDRRFHAQPLACPECGPQLWLAKTGQPGVPIAACSAQAAIAATSALLQQGEIVAIKGIGGFHLACDATNEVAVSQLRRRKQRYHKPLALMARDLAMVRHYCAVGTVEQQLLESPAAPIVILQRRDQAATQETPGAEALVSEAPPIAPAVAPGLSTLGMLLPYTPLHHLLLAALDRPLVLTSGNPSDAPPCIDNQEAHDRLAAISPYALLHNRTIVNRVDDSVVRVVRQSPQVLRRARGYAPAPLPLPAGFQGAPQVWAMGSELKTTICFLHDDQAIVSQHLGDLADSLVYADYQATIARYQSLFDCRPSAIAVDLHPEYVSSKLGQAWATESHVPLHGIQHHHAHVAACLADNGVPLATEPVLGIALDGLGYGTDQTLWGGEFLIADYRESWRLAWFQPVAMLGGTQAVKQPWRNTYAHLMAAFAGDWSALQGQYGSLELLHYLGARPRSLLDQLLTQNLNSPLASSAGRLFDAVAAAVGICREAVSYEGQAAIELEALVTEAALMTAEAGYPFQIYQDQDGMVLQAAPMWRSLLADLAAQVPPAVIAARFHIGLTEAIAQLAIRLAEQFDLSVVVLTGGVCQNQLLADGVHTRLEALGLTVLTHHQFPPNDGGIALGQAVIAAARTLNPLSPYS